MSAYQITTKWTVYIHYTEADGAVWSEEFDLLADDYDAAHANATRIMRDAYEPGGKLELVQGPRLERRSAIAGAWMEVTA